MWLWRFRQNTTTPTWKAFLHSLVQRICPGPPKEHATSQRWCRCLLEMTAKEKQNSHRALLFQVKKERNHGSVVNIYFFWSCVTPRTSWVSLKHVQFYQYFVNSFSFWFPESHPVAPSRAARAFPSHGEEDMEGRLTCGCGLPKCGVEIGLVGDSGSGSLVLNFSWKQNGKSGSDSARWSGFLHTHRSADVWRHI